MREVAAKELYTHEVLALVSCFIFPLLSAYLLHAIRSQLSRPSEGLVSNYNLTIFLLASEVRPLSHLIKLVQSRTLHLQRIVASSPHAAASQEAKLRDLSKRIEDLEAHAVADISSVHGQGGVKDDVSKDVRRSLQPDIDALNRAVRRYEKRATIQTMQTEARLQELEARLHDALSLAAAAAQTSQARRASFSGILLEWATTIVILPLQAGWNLINLPTMVVGKVFGLRSGERKGKGKRVEGDKKAGRYAMHGKVGVERLQGRGIKKG
jgi:hypothetical protein